MRNWRVRNAKPAARRSVSVRKEKETPQPRRPQPQRQTGKSHKRRGTANAPSDRRLYGCSPSRSRSRCNAACQFATCCLHGRPSPRALCNECIATEVAPNPSPRPPEQVAKVRTTIAPAYGQLPTHAGSTSTRQRPRWRQVPWRWKGIVGTQAGTRAIAPRHPPPKVAGTKKTAGTQTTIAGARKHTSPSAPACHAAGSTAPSQRNACNFADEALKP